MKLEADTPRHVELWVESSANGRYKARVLDGAYQTDVNKAVKDLGRYLDSRWPDDSRRIDIVSSDSDR